MSPVAEPERLTQNRVVALFRDELGYRYLGDLTDRDANSNAEEGLLSGWLARQGCTPAQVNAALHRLRTEVLAALVPRPRAHLTRYHGVFAPHSRWRAEVTPAGRGKPTAPDLRTPV